MGSSEDSVSDTPLLATPVSPTIDRRPPGTDDDDRTSRFGHLVAAVLTVVGLYVVNNLPDWDILPFLTDDFDRVLPLINLSLGANLVISLLRLVQPRKWFVILTDVIGTAFGLPALVRTWQVFPFDFDAGFWDLAVRVVLVIAIAGSIIGMIVGVVRLVARLTRAW